MEGLKFYLLWMSLQNMDKMYIFAKIYVNLNSDS